MKLTERKMKDASPSLAALYQRKFLVIGEPLRPYATTARPAVQEVAIGHSSRRPSTIRGTPRTPVLARGGRGAVPFKIDALDHEGRPVPSSPR